MDNVGVTLGHAAELILMLLIARKAVGRTYGTLVIGGQRFRVRRLRLRGSGIECTAFRRGPAAEVSGWFTLFGEDGGGIGQSESVVTVPAAGRWGWRKVIWRLSVTEIVGTGHDDPPRGQR